MQIAYWIIIFLVILIVGYKLFREIKRDIENHDKKKLYQWLGIFTLCIVTFVLCRTVFYKPLQNILWHTETDITITGNTTNIDDLFWDQDK